MKIKRKLIATNENDRIIMSIQHDGHALTCPIKQPVPIQNQFGSMSFIEHNCTSKCIGFDIKTNDLMDGKSFFHCGHSQNCCFEVEIDNGINENQTIKSLKFLNTGDL
jgi:hypothetical protein